jgi:hypothetical protein
MNPSRAIAQSIDAGEGFLERTGPILNLNFHLSSSPWQMGPGWAVLAGALAGHAPILGGENLLRLAGSLILADTAWGALWLQVPSGRNRLTEGERVGRLPYAAFQSPMRRILTVLVRGTPDDSGAGWHGMLAGLILAATLSLLLGGPAIILSSMALLASVGVRFLIGRGRKPAFLTALLCIGLPWILGVSLGWAQGTTPPLSQIVAPLMVGAAFMILGWTIDYVRFDGQTFKTWPAWLGQITLLGTLTVLREPTALVMIGCLTVVPNLWLSRNGTSLTELSRAMRKSEPWWLASMLVAALTVHS